MDNDKIKNKKLYKFLESLMDNPELTSEAFQKAIMRDDIDPQTKERLKKWVKEIEFWEEYSNIYRNLEKTRPYNALTKTLGRLIEPLPGDTWLDAGCGPAKISQVIWKKSDKKVKKIIGTDIVLEPAEQTLNRPEEDMPLKLVYANMGEGLPFPDAHFDGIVANLVAPYVIDYEGKTGKSALMSVLKEMFRVLKPNGQMIWSTPKPNVRFQLVFLASLPDMLNIYHYIRYKDFTRILQGSRILKHALAIQRKGKNGDYTFLSTEELDNILQEIGFIKPVWKKSFTQQVLVNKVFKP